MMYGGRSLGVTGFGRSWARVPEQLHQSETPCLFPVTLPPSLPVHVHQIPWMTKHPGDTRPHETIRKVFVVKWF